MVSETVCILYYFIISSVCILYYFIRSLCISPWYKTEWLSTQLTMKSSHMYLWNIRLHPLTLQVTILNGHKLKWNAT